METKMKVVDSLDNLMNGGVNERVLAELSKLWENVYDMRTDPGKARSLSLVVKIKPNNRRDAAEMSVDVGLKLAPPVPMTQTVLIRQRDDGSVEAVEQTAQVPGQLNMDGGEQDIPNVVKFERGDNQSM